MDIFVDMKEMGHERVLFCSNPAVGLQAIIAVHSTVLGPGLGGCRMWPYASADEALTDVLRLSRGMTFKAAAAGLHLGGGKAVIIGDPRKDKTEALMRAFGRYVDSLNGLYLTAEDVGTNMQDMAHILTETRWVTGVSASVGGSGDPSPVTALGVLQGIKAAVQWKFQTNTLAGRTVAIQGLGNVGGHLARYLHQEGARVVGCDIHPEVAARLHDEIGLEVVAPDAIYDVECDVFAPCALGAILNDTTIPRLHCAIVSGAANNQLAEEDQDGPRLEARGILYAPDFVVNAGGLINVYNEISEGGYNRDRAMHMARGIYQNTLRVFEIAAAHAIPTYRAAERLALDRIARVQALGSRHWGRGLAVRDPR